MSIDQLDRVAMIGASDTCYFMTDTKPEDLLRWWEVKVGLRDQDPPNWPMRLGSAVGDLILDEYERQTCEAVTRRQEVIASPINPRIRATLDGFSVTRNAVIEAKFASPYFKREDIFRKYYSQVALQMHCAGVDHGFLVIAQGTNDPIEIECIRDAQYEAVLTERCAAMLLCMDTLTPPVQLPEPTPPEKWRTIDLDVEVTNWGSEMLAALVEYDETAATATAHAAWGKMARDLVPDDVGRVITENFTLARNRKGVIAITRRAA